MRTTTAAHTQGAAAALSVAFYGGSIMGLCVASLGLLGLGSLYLVFGGDPHTAHAIHGFGMGASTVALFSRVGGGIYTKSADVGSDLVGKLEAGIPEDDPRNPGVIADNVGDNVGDVAGMGSDIFESYCGAMIATIAIASTMAIAQIGALAPQLEEAPARAALMFLPLALASIGLLASITGIMVVRLLCAQRPALALRSGTVAAPLLFIVAAWFVIDALGIEAAVWWSVICGAAGGIVIGLVTEWYTSSTPVLRIAAAGQTGPATVLNLVAPAPAAEPAVEPITETVTEPAKVMRIGSMVKQLLEEARTSPLDEASRERMAEIYERSIVELADALSPDLQEELHMLALPFKDGEVPSEGELRARARRGSAPARRGFVGTRRSSLLHLVRTTSCRRRPPAAVPASQRT